jgi:hypothetical protein
MKPQPLDRLLTILISCDLILVLWWLAATFSAHSQTVTDVF